MDAIRARAGLSAATLCAALAAGALVLALGGAPTSSSAASVAPVLVTVTSNLTCDDFEPAGADWNELKVDPNGDGIFADDDGPLKVKIENTTNDKSFDWHSLDYVTNLPPGIGVDAVYVKGGSGGSHLYLYDPESIGDTGLSSPGAGESNGISHISFCYDSEGEGATETPEVTTTRPPSTGTPGLTQTPAVTTTAIASATSTPVPTDTPTPTATNTPTATPTNPALTHTPTRTRTPDNDTTSTPESTEVAGEDVTPISEVLGATPPAGPSVSGLPATGDGWQEWRGGYGAIAFLGLVFALFGVCLYSFWRARQEP